MKLGEYVVQAASNLRDMKLRTGLTALGVAVGIGALVAMVGFGQGVEHNVTRTFEDLDLFRSITVLPRGALSARRPSGRPSEGTDVPSGPSRALDDEAVRELARLPGVEAAFPEDRFPATLRFQGAEELRLVQVIPAAVSASRLLKLEAGRPFSPRDGNQLILSRSLASRLGIRPPQSAVDRTIILSSLSFDFSRLNPAGLARLATEGRLPLIRNDYDFRVVGLVETAGFGGFGPLASEVYISTFAAGRIARLPFASVWDLFGARGGRPGYPAVNLRLTSPAEADSVVRRVRDLGFSTFALIEQFDQIRTSSVYLDMILAAISMVAIFVAALGIINTMVMSILERYSEIGLMKAVGASNADVKRIFFFESGLIGLGGGLMGVGLGLAVSRVVNGIITALLARQGVPPLEYFSFPFWLCLGAVAFAVAVSLAAGVYPAWRAARVDPAVALRHD
jgi:putative ABC transport system permease protein